MIVPAILSEPTKPMSPQKPQPKKRRGFLWFVLLLLIIGGVLVGTGALSIEKKQASEEEKTISAATTKKENRPVAVTVETVTTRPIQRKLSVVGSLYGRDEIVITPKVEGRIIKVHHDVGDIVKSGDLLIEIDDTDYRLAVAEAEKALELELSKLGIKDIPKDRFDVTKLPSVAKAASLEKNALSRLERQRRTGTATTIEDREQAETDYKVAQANYNQAVLEAQTTLASVQLRKAILDTAKQRLADTRVTVPYPNTSGTIAIKTTGSNSMNDYAICTRMVSEGEMLRISPTTSMSAFKLVIDKTLKLNATVPERHLQEVKVGQEVDLEVESYRNKLFKGRVARVNPSVDRTNRTFQIEVEVPNDNRILRSGSFAKASVYTHIDNEAMTVPEESLVSFAGVTKVFIINDNKADGIPVQPSTRLNIKSKDRTFTWVEIQGDVKPGDVVVTSGQSQLSDGKPVRLRDGK